MMFDPYKKQHPKAKFLPQDAALINLNTVNRLVFLFQVLNQVLRI